MRKHKWKLLGAAALALIVVGTLVLWPQPDRITRKNYNRVTKGMSRAEVYDMLGPPGDYRTVLTEREPELPRSTELSQANTEGPPAGERDANTLNWRGDEGDISVLIYPERVLDKDFRDTERAEQTALENLLWRTERQWRCWFSE